MSFLFADSSPLTVKNSFIVEEGSPADFLCTVNEPITECSFEIFDETYSVTEDSDNDEFKYFGRSFNDGDCGITIKNMTTSYLGRYRNKCFVNTTNGRKNLEGHIYLLLYQVRNIYLLKPPDPKAACSTQDRCVVLKLQIDPAPTTCSCTCR